MNIIHIKILVNSKMDCGLNTSEVLQPGGTMRGIEIVPEGCQAVSEDVCKSGYMAPTENVSFPENSLNQCCKCKEGETCPLCKNPEACTESEKEELVTSEDCFGSAKVTPMQLQLPPLKQEEDVTMTYIMIGGGIVILIVLFLVTRRPKTP
jgi:hypothetical protein